jgi:hypothetical protein
MITDVNFVGDQQDELNAHFARRLCYTFPTSCTRDSTIISPCATFYRYLQLLRSVATPVVIRTRAIYEP